MVRVRLYFTVFHSTYVLAYCRIYWYPCLSLNQDNLRPPTKILKILSDHLLGGSFANKISHGLQMCTAHFLLRLAIPSSLESGKSQLGRNGATLVSTTLRFCTPDILKSLSTQVLFSSILPIFTVPQTCDMMIAVCRTWAYVGMPSANASFIS